MEVGFLTGCLGKMPLEEIIAWAGANGVKCIEINATHLGEDTPERDAAILAALGAAGVRLSGIWVHGGVLDDPARGVRNLRAGTDRCVRLGIDVCIATAGIAPAGVTREEAIDGPFTDIYGPACEYASSKGVKIALENWYATLIMNFELWDRMLDRVPAANFGFNFDPSHLEWQGIDYLAGVERYGKRIFHVHAKDTEVRSDVLARVGVNGKGWWRYCIPGQGRVRWGEFIARLRRIGYNGVLSIEHEDGFIPPKDGILLGKKFLEQYI